MQAIEFDIRPKSLPQPVYSPTRSEGAPQMDTSDPRVGEQVVLCVGNVRIHAVVDTVVDRNYAGTVTGFSGHDERTFQGVNPGDMIYFGYEHIFSCSL